MENVQNLEAGSGEASTTFSLRAGYRPLKYNRKPTVFLACKTKGQSSRQPQPLESESEILEKRDQKEAPGSMYKFCPTIFK